MKSAVAKACLLAVVAVLLPVCGGGGGDVRVVGTFSGHADFATGRLVIDELTIGTPDRAGGRIEVRNPPPGVYGQIDVVQNGIPDDGPPDTVELYVIEGTVGTGEDACGRGFSFCGDVRLRSFFAGAELRGVFVQLTHLTPPTSHEGFGDFPPAAAVVDQLDLDATYGLWDYGNIAANGSAVRTWKFDNFDGTDFRFAGVVTASIEPVGSPVETVCGNAGDDDGDGKTDCADPDCSIDLACNGGSEICGNGVDDDTDAAVDCDDADCAADIACGPQPEVCDNGRDDDLDGQKDCIDFWDCHAFESCQWVCIPSDTNCFDNATLAVCNDSAVPPYFVPQDCPDTRPYCFINHTIGDIYCAECNREGASRCVGSSNYEVCEGGFYSIPYACDSGPPCDPAIGRCGDHTFRCDSNDIYWYDGWGRRLEKKQECGTCGCFEGETVCHAGSLRCDDNDIYFFDCNGVRQTLETECGECGCVDGSDACTVDNEASFGCACFGESCGHWSADVWWRDCNGNWTTMKEECDACGCSAGVCGYDAERSYRCDSDDIYWFDCHDVRQAVRTECGACGCVAGEKVCAVDNQHSFACRDGDVWWRDCEGNWTTLKEECGDCNCDADGCVLVTDYRYACDLMGTAVYWYDCKGAQGAVKEDCNDITQWCEFDHCTTYPCEKDGDCVSGYCVGGLCALEPEACLTDGDCPPDRFCVGNVCVAWECKGDPDCDPGEVCDIFGVCGTEERCVAGCRNDGQCPDGQICGDSGRLCPIPECIPGCRSDEDCAPWQQCGFVSDQCEPRYCDGATPCPEGAYCDGGGCQPVPDNCTSDPDCPPGWFCRGNECVEWECQADSDCQVNSWCDTEGMCGGGANSCVEGCRDDSGCPFGMHCPGTCGYCENGCRDDSNCFPWDFCNNGDCLPRT